MVIYRHTTGSMGGRRTEDMDELNYIDPYDESARNEGIFRGGNTNTAALGGSLSTNSGMRRSRSNPRASRERLRLSRNHRTTGLDDSRRFPEANVGHQSGLEGYGRYLGVPGAAGSYDDGNFDDMESSVYPEESGNSYQGRHDVNFSLNAHNLDGGLESYGRYLGSSSTHEECEATVQHNENGMLRLSHESGFRGDLDYFRETHSGYEGLGSYGQPYIENEDMGLTRANTTENMDTFSHSISYEPKY